MENLSKNVQYKESLKHATVVKAIDIGVPKLEQIAQKNREKYVDVTVNIDKIFKCIDYNTKTKKN